ncbi:hypothetical protein ACE6H2_026463 [Prunus campanulata]
MKFSSTSDKDPSTTTFVEEPKSTRGINTMSHVVKRKIQKIKHVVEFNKRGRPHGKAIVEMQSYIGVLACTKVPLVDKKWTQLPKDLKEQIWEVVQMTFVVGEGCKKMVLSSAAKKWKDFKYNVTRQYILPFAHDKDKLKEPHELCKFIEKSRWDAFVASRLSPDFEAVHSGQKQRREKLEYNHRLSRKGYVGLEDELEENMPGEEIDRALLWKKAREDKTGNIPNPKVAEKAKLIVKNRRCLLFTTSVYLSVLHDDLQKQVSEGILTVSGTNDILTLALGTPEHGGRVRGAGAGVTPTQFFNLLKQQRLKFGDKLKESVREVVREETLRIEAKSRETIMEAVRAEREAMLAYIRQLVPNFDPSQMLQTPISPIPPIILPPQGQSPKNPMSDKASCSGATNIRPLALELEDPKPEADTARKEKEDTDLSKLDMPPPLLALCQHFQTKLLPNGNEALTIHMPKEVFGFEHDTFLFTEDVLQFGSMVEIGTTVILVYMRFLFDYLKMANVVNVVGLVDPGLVSSGAGSISDRIKNLTNRLQTANGNQFFLVPYSPGHWVMVIVRPLTKTAYYMNSLPKRMVDDDMRNIVNTQQAIWKNLHGTPEQPTSVECGYYVMRFMRDIIHDPDLNFEKKCSLTRKKINYKQEDIDEVRHEWAEFVNNFYYILSALSQSIGYDSPSSHSSSCYILTALSEYPCKYNPNLFLNP